jgi:hypothetical protein
VAGRAYLTSEELQELKDKGGGKAVKEAFNWLYGVPTNSGNGAWLRRMLLGPGGLHG